MTRTAPRVGVRLVKAVAALAALLAVIVGVPAALIAIGAVPHGLPSVHAAVDSLTRKDDTAAYFRIAGAAVVWIAWAVFTAVTVKEAAASIRLHGPRPAPPRRGLARLGPAALVAMIAVLFAAGPTAMTVTATHAAAAPPGRVSTSVSTNLQSPSATQPRPQQRELPTYPVQRYDTVWRIAERHLPGNPAERYKDIVRLNPDTVGPDNEIVPGEVLTLPADAFGLPHPPTSTTAVQDVPVQPGDTLSGLAADRGVSDWHSVWPLNRDRAEPGGERFTDPDHIEPGWTVQLPTAAAATAPPQSNAPTRTQPAHDPPPPAHDAPPAATPTSTHPTPAPPSAPASTPTTSSRPEPATPVAHIEARSSSGLDAWNAVYFGAGALLAAGAFTTLQALRRRQFRNRRPGRTISSAPAGLIPAEKALLTHGPTGLADVEFLDYALRGLAAATAAQPDLRLPEIVAARMVDDQLDIRLTAPHPTPPPGPWTVDESGCWWTIRVGDDLPAAATDAEQHLAPYPTLVAVGHDQTGGNWLLDLESAGALALTGDPGRCLDLGRFIAAELAVNAWSDQLTVTMVGFGAELVPLNPDRLRYTDDLNSAASQLAGDLRTLLEASATVGIDVLTGRMRAVAADSWMPQILLVAPQVTHAAADTGTLDRLLTALREHPERTAVAVVLVGEQASTWSALVQAAIAASGSLSIPGLGLQMTAQGLPAEQVAALGGLLAHASMVTDSPMPAAAGRRPFERFVDAAGGLRPEFTLPRAPLGPATPTLVRPGASSITIRSASPEADPASESAVSVLPYEDEEYLRDGATTAQELQALAPRVDDTRRAAIVAADARLDADLADWRDQHSMTPKLILLGPVELRAHGTRPPKRISYYTEVAAFLATRDHGATAEQVAAAFEVSMTSIYSRLTVVRNWLGTNPATGEKYLPDSTKSDAGQARGVGVYECDGLLVDAELFRRLRARGEALGGDEGIAYLEAALSLVEGPPFDHLRPGGYGWLADKPLDHYLAAGIVDVAHTVHLHHLHAGNLEQARTAAETAQKAAPYEDTPRLDLVAVMRATGHSEEADRYLREEICNRSESGEAPDDLPERTEAVVREWQSRAS